jgi:hypothetical protein
MSATLIASKGTAVAGWRAPALRRDNHSHSRVLVANSFTSYFATKNYSAKAYQGTWSTIG